MPITTINDIQMYYEVHGKGDPLVLIAGFSVDHTLWATVVEAFAMDYQVILLDNRGAGQSSVPDGPYTIDQMAGDVAALCSLLEIDQAVFIGNSMGGLIVQALLHHHEHLVKKAIICNSTTHLNVSYRWFMEAKHELMQAAAPLKALIKADFSLCFSYAFLSQPGAFETFFDMSLNNPYPFTLTGFTGQMAALNTADTRDWLADIHTPCLVVSGDDDIILLPRCSAAIASGIAGAKSFCFQACGHLPHIEYPDQFVTLANDFIQQ